MPGLTSSQEPGKQWYEDLHDDLGEDQLYENDDMEGVKNGVASVQAERPTKDIPETWLNRLLPSTEPMKGIDWQNVFGRVFVLNERGIFRPLDRAALVQDLGRLTELKGLTGLPYNLGDILQQFTTLPLGRIHHYANTGEYLKALFEQRKLTDVLIHVDDKLFAAHRVALACHSVYFARAFILNQHQKHKLTQLRLKKVNTHAFYSVLRFMYTGQLSINRKNVEDLLKVANQLQIPAVLYKCLDYLGHVPAKDMDEEKELDPQAVKMQARALLGTHLRDLVHDETFLQKRVEVVEMALGDDGVLIDSELDVFSSAMAWLAYDLGPRRKHTERLMRQVRFTCMTPEEVIEATQANCFIRNSPYCRNRVLEAIWLMTVKGYNTYDVFKCHCPTPRRCLEGMGPLPPVVMESSYDNPFEQEYLVDGSKGPQFLTPDQDTAPVYENLGKAGALYEPSARPSYLEEMTHTLPNELKGNQPSSVFCNVHQNDDASYNNPRELQNDDASYNNPRELSASHVATASCALGMGILYPANPGAHDNYCQSSGGGSHSSPKKSHQTDSYEKPHFSTDGAAGVAASGGYQRPLSKLQQRSSERDQRHETQSAPHSDRRFSQPVSGMHYRPSLQSLQRSYCSVPSFRVRPMTSVSASLHSVTDKVHHHPADRLQKCIKIPSTFDMSVTKPSFTKNKSNVSVGRAVNTAGASAMSLGRPVGARDTSARSLGRPVGTRDTSATSLGRPVGTRDTSVTSLGRSVVSRDTSVTSLGRPVSTRDTTATSLGRPVGTRDTSATSLGRPVGTRDTSATSLDRPVGTASASAMSFRRSVSTGGASATPLGGPVNTTSTSAMSVGKRSSTVGTSATSVKPRNSAVMSAKYGGRSIRSGSVCSVDSASSLTTQRPGSLVGKPLMSIGIPGSSTGKSVIPISAPSKSGTSVSKPGGTRSRRESKKPSTQKTSETSRFKEIFPAADISQSVSPSSPSHESPSPLPPPTEFEDVPHFTFYTSQFSGQDLKGRMTGVEVDFQRQAVSPPGREGPAGGEQKPRMDTERATGMSTTSPVASAPFVEFCEGDLLAVGGFVDSANRLGSSQAQRLDGIQQKWEKFSEMPETRLSFAAAFLKSRLVVCGGYDPDYSRTGTKATTDTFLFDSAAQRWERGGHMIYARAFHAVCVLGGRLFAVGGQDEHSRALRTAEVYDPEADRWSLLCSMSYSRIGASAAAFQGEVMAVGGYWKTSGKEDRPCPLLTTTECLDLEINSWRNGGCLRLPRAQACLVATEQHLYLCGGVTRHPVSSILYSICDVDRYDPDTNQWTHLTDLQTARHNAGATVLGTKICVVGGVSTNINKVLRSVECYDTQTGTWDTSLPELPLGARSLACVVISC